MTCPAKHAGPLKDPATQLRQLLSAVMAGCAFDLLYDCAKHKSAEDLRATYRLCVSDVAHFRSQHGHCDPFAVLQPIVGLDAWMRCARLACDQRRAALDLDLTSLVGIAADLDAAHESAGLIVSALPAWVEVLLTYLLRLETDQPLRLRAISATDQDMRQSRVGEQMEYVLACLVQPAITTLVFLDNVRAFLVGHQHRDSDSVLRRLGDWGALAMVGTLDGPTPVVQVGSKCLDAMPCAAQELRSHTLAFARHLAEGGLQYEAPCKSVHAIVLTVSPITPVLSNARACESAQPVTLTVDTLRSLELGLGSVPVLRAMLAVDPQRSWVLVVRSEIVQASDEVVVAPTCVAVFVIDF